jgi:Uma2 family endonuclease
MATTDFETLPEPSQPVFRLSVDQYHAMIREGIITEDDPVELLEGVLVLKMGKNPNHPLAVRLLTTVMDRVLPSGFHFKAQEPITLSDGEPEPDGAVVRGGPRDYADRHPGPADVALVIEVADTSLDRDRGVKLRSYARAGIAEYWIVNLVDGIVEVYGRPGMKGRTPGYAEPVIKHSGEELSLSVAGARAIAVDEILP